MNDENYCINKPSSLYHLKPMEIGTPKVESITGYIKRLAEAHKVSVGNLIVGEIIPNIHERSYLNKVHQFLRKEVKDLNCFSNLSKETIRILADKTLNDGLIYSTMGIFENLLNSRYMLREYQAWCPICFEEGREKGETIYEQLLWNFKDVEICKKHQVILSDTCPHCNRKVSVLNNLSRVGFCNYCGCWLGSKNCENTCDSHNNKQWQDWVYDNVGQLLALAPKLKDMNTLRFSKNIMNLIYNNNLSIRGFATNVNVSHNVIINWISKKKPLLKNVLQLSYRLDYPLIDILTKDIIVFNSFIDSRKVTLDNNIKTKIDFDKLKKEIDDAINSDSGLSLNQISTLTGVSKLTITRHFPNEVTKLKNQYNKQQELIKAEKLSLIKRTMVLLRSQGLYPGIKALGRELGKRVIINDEERKLWLATLEELGYKPKL